MRRTFLAGALTAVLGLAVGPSTAAPAPEPACRTANFEGDGFVVCRYAPGEGELRLALNGPGGPLGSFRALKTALGEDAGRVVFAMNAGMYEPDRAPVGLFVEAGRQRAPLNRAAGAGNFYLAPNGVFWVDDAGAPHVDETGAFAASGVKPRWATQSGPLLVSGGALHPRVMPNGTSLAVRNGVGVKGGQALFVISDRPVSFGRFARFLKDELGCPDALYLDGTVSALWAPGLNRRDDQTGLGPLVLVLKR
ncbi:phosphodiester glycosidase family protein [Caulobacter sp. 17J80-11]|uniref:phosphodiester glycosidase family protein n=1 Tax=Caulobacter sp. 17J80-11 TaxID=2763502 RepID=UPI0016536C07|nr:phosphodiester glycosidase family protein [Caulobacter sp. 17J80-11]MBC6981354.1 phosphodiester glycosidase family protein [Caulobacter sp. 17J80-11]